MKKAVLFLILGAGLLQLGAVIYSSSSGGYWTNPATWQGGVVPGSSDQVVVTSTIDINQNVACAGLTVTSTGLVRNWIYDTWSLSVLGNLSNAGTITNHGNGGHLLFMFTGDMVNSGVINNTRIYTNGTANQNLSNTGSYQPSEWWDEVSASQLTLQTDLYTTRTWIDLNGSTLVMNGHELNLNEGYLREATLSGGNGASLELANGAYLALLNGNEVILQGTAILSAGISFGTLINQGTMYNTAEHITLAVTDRLENYGSITNNPNWGYLTVVLSGDLYHYGSISNQSFYLNNSAQKVLWQSDTAGPIRCAFFEKANGTPPLQALSNLRFQYCNVDLNGGTLKLFNGRSASNLYFFGGLLQASSLETQGFAELEMADGAWAENIQAGDLVLKGIVRLGSNCVFDDVAVYGTVHGISNTDIISDWTGNVANFGSIQNNPAGGLFLLYCRKDLSNYGSLANYRVFIAGSQNQQVINTGSISVPADGFRLVSGIGPAIWMFNGAPANEDNPQLEWPINIVYQGVWQPLNAQTGRLITVGNTATELDLPASFEGWTSGPGLKLQWGQVANAVYYNLYATENPTAAFPAGWGTPVRVFDNDSTDGVVSHEPDTSQPQKFYRVTAVN